MKKKIIPKEWQHRSEGELKALGIWHTLPDAPAPDAAPAEPKPDKPAKAKPLATGQN